MTNEDKLRALLWRCSTILSHMAAERTGTMARLVKGRWLIADEPLRSDAKNILPEIGKVLRPEAKQ